MIAKKWIIRIVLIAIGVIGILAVRIFENQWFYDPLLPYFKGNYQSSALPNIQLSKFYTHLGFRYLLNSLFSLAIIYGVFMDWALVRFSSVLFALLFIIFMVLVYIALQNYNPAEYSLLFYSRKFLIQPLWLLLFLAAFYYQKKKNLLSSHEI